MSANASPLPTFARSVCLTDFDQLGSVFANWQGQVEQVSSGRFQGRTQVVVGSVVRLVAAEGNQRVRLHGRDASGLLGIYPLIDGMTTAAWMGSVCHGGQIVVGGSEDKTDICSGRTFAGRVAFIHPEVLEQAARSMLNLDEVTLLRDSAIHSPSPAGFAEVNRLLARLLSAALNDPLLLGTPEGCRLEQGCLRALVAALLPPAPQAHVSPPRRAQLLSRAEAYLREHLGDSVGAIDLCREIGASDRTLRLVFHERYGVGPLTYFRFLRLNAAHARLRSDPHLTVADAAREIGFRHLGNFAADYRRLFGRRLLQRPVRHVFAAR